MHETDADQPDPVTDARGSRSGCSSLPVNWKALRPRGLVVWVASRPSHRATSRKKTPSALRSRLMAALHCRTRSLDWLIDFAMRKADATLR